MVAAARAGAPAPDLGPDLGLTAHPAAELFPVLSAEDLDDLTADIAAYGLRHPLAITPNGRLLDGRHRLLACRRAGVAPTWTTVTDEPWRYVLSVNLHRRHLTDTQRAMIAAEIADRARGGVNGSGGNPSDEGLPPTQAETCALLSVSHGAMVRARRVHTTGTSALAAGVRDGVVPLTTASRIATEYEPARQDAYVAAVRDHGADPVATAPPAPVYGATAARTAADAEPITARPSAPGGASTGAGDRAVTAQSAAPGTAGPAGPARTRQALAQRVRTLAAQGCSSRQIAADTGVSAARVRDLARDHGIDIAADRVLGRTRRLDPHRVLRETVAGLDALCPGADLVDPADLADLDPETAAEWADSMTHSMRRLARLRKQLHHHASATSTSTTSTSSSPSSRAGSTEEDLHHV